MEEVPTIMDRMKLYEWMQSNIMYGGGLRVGSLMGLRIKDLLPDRRQVVVRRPKGRHDYLTILPEIVIEPLIKHLEWVRQEHDNAMSEGYGGVELPYALARKYPKGSTELGWQYVFPSRRPSRDPATGVFRRHHENKSVIQRKFKEAVRSAGIARNCGCHTLRHSFATHLLMTGTDIATVQRLMGHKDLTSTQVYLHIAEVNGYAIISPADRIQQPRRSA